MGQATVASSPSESVERLLRPAEVSDMLDISTHTLKVWRHRDDDFGPRYKRFPGERGEIRYLLSEVMEFMRSDLHGSYAAEVAQRNPDAEGSPDGRE